jgi:hypothetical protein
LIRTDSVRMGSYVRDMENVPPTTETFRRVASLFSLEVMVWLNQQSLRAASADDQQDEEGRWNRSRSR